MVKSDIVFTTNNNVLLDNYEYNPTIMCVQKEAEKKIVNENLLRKSNKLSFGNSIGTITNRVTGMFDLISLYNKDSREYKTLAYRIMCGQLYQQNEINVSFPLW